MTSKMDINHEGRLLYEISYEESFDALKDIAKENSFADKKIMIISDTKVASNYMDAILCDMEPLCKEVHSFIFDEGEKSKNLDTVREAYRALIEKKFDRHDMILALGGGVTGDMAGFTAATFLRGIDFIQIPTSLLSMVDSSIGGKTGVDFDEYKNMVGAFKMPVHVYINMSVLKTLDRRQIVSGMGEVIKSALIKDASFFDWIEENAGSIEKLSEEYDSSVYYNLIYRSDLVKKNVVENDPYEKGERGLLNFGHTLGHALEKYMNFELLHGECVLIGSIMSSYISFKLGYLSDEELRRTVKLIKGYELPKLPGDIDIDRIVEYTKNDKKVVGDKIKFILLRGIGDAFITKEVSADVMKEAIEVYLKEYN